MSPPFFVSVANHKTHVVQKVFWFSPCLCNNNQSFIYPILKDKDVLKLMGTFYFLLAAFLHSQNVL